MRVFNTPLLLILFAMLFATGCKSNKDTTTINEDEQATVVISFEQGPSSVPHAPEYKLEVYSNRQMFLHALKNLDKEGKFMRTLTKDEYKQLIDAFTDASFFDLKDEYLNATTNKPTRYLTFNHQGQSKTIKDNEGAPEALAELEFLVKSYLDRVAWSKMSW